MPAAGMPGCGLNALSALQQLSVLTLHGAHFPAAVPPFVRHLPRLDRLKLMPVAADDPGWCVPQLCVYYVAKAIPLSFQPEMHQLNHHDAECCRATEMTHTLCVHGHRTRFDVGSLSHLVQLGNLQHLYLWFLGIAMVRCLPLAEKTSCYNSNSADLPDPVFVTRWRNAIQAIRLAFPKCPIDSNDGVDPTTVENGNEDSMLLVTTVWQKTKHLPLSFP